MRIVRKAFAASAVGLAATLAAAPGWAQSGNQSGRQNPYRGQIRANSKKVLHKDGKTLLWAGPRGSRPDPNKPDMWFDFSGAPIPPAELQYGIGRDTIPSIDDPMFVAPDDPRLLKTIPPPGYGRGRAPKTNDEIDVIGYVDGDDARAYPTALLDQHELVNHSVGGKPVTVGW